MLDLTDRAVIERLGVDGAVLVDDDDSRTQEPADAARAAGFEGLLARSAALPGRRTLVVHALGLAGSEGIRRLRRD